MQIEFSHTVPSVYPLLKQVLRTLKGPRAILDGEIVVLDEKGRSNFYDLMARRGEPRYYAFDLVWLNGTAGRKITMTAAISYLPSRIRAGIN